MENFEYKKSLGQNFLFDQNIINKIINSIDLKDESLIIEIGPGSGTLTKELVKLNANVVSFEIDERLKPSLSELKNENLKIIFQDFLTIDLKKFLEERNYRHLYFIANIPYYITTSIINKIIFESEPEEIIFMVQKEMADRLCVLAGSSDYGSINVFLQYKYDISKVTNVSKESFYPKPKVDSAVIKLKRKENIVKVTNETKFYKLINDSFKFKRKNLRNNLKDYDLSKIENVLKKSNKDLSFRAESLTIEEFINISNELN